VNNTILWREETDDLNAQLEADLAVRGYAQKSARRLLFNILLVVLVIVVVYLLVPPSFRLPMAIVLGVTGMCAGMIPSISALWQYSLLGFHRLEQGNHKIEAVYPNVTILVPAWNEDAVIRRTVDRLLLQDYPQDRIRVVVIDDGSTDNTPEIMQDLMQQYPGRVEHVRRTTGGQGKAFTLNAGLTRALETTCGEVQRGRGEALTDQAAEPWTEAILIMDADVLFTSTALRKMTRHFADPVVGAVTAYIQEGSQPAGAVSRFVGYEYITAQAAGRRTQNILGAQICLAGGAQLHRRENIEQLGGRFETATLAEDTVTTLLTQLGGRSCVFEGNAIVIAEEPDNLSSLWTQRLRWARGNIQVMHLFPGIWGRKGKAGNLGGLGIATMWFTTTMMPVWMILGTAGLILLWLTNGEWARRVTEWGWMFAALAYLFTTMMTFVMDRRTWGRTWREAIFFPGLVSLVFILLVLLPGPMDALMDIVYRFFGRPAGATPSDYQDVFFFAAIWSAVAMIPAYFVMLLERVLGKTGWGWIITRPLLYLVGYGPFLCACTAGGYILEIRGKGQRWDKTVKTGRAAGSMPDSQVSESARTRTPMTAGARVKN